MALMHFSLALKLFTHVNNKLASSIILNNMGNVNVSLERYDAAIANYKQSLFVYDQSEAILTRGPSIDEIGIKIVRIKRRENLKNVLVAKYYTIRDADDLVDTTIVGDQLEGVI